MLRLIATVGSFPRNGLPSSLESCRRCAGSRTASRRWSAAESNSWRRSGSRSIAATSVRRVDWRSERNSSQRSVRCSSFKDSASATSVNSNNAEVPQQRLTVCRASSRRRACCAGCSVRCSSSRITGRSSAYPVRGGSRSTGSRSSFNSSRTVCSAKRAGMTARSTLALWPIWNVRSQPSFVSTRGNAKSCVPERKMAGGDPDGRAASGTPRVSSSRRFWAIASNSLICSLALSCGRGSILMWPGPRSGFVKNESRMFQGRRGDGFAARRGGGRFGIRTPTGWLAMPAGNFIPGGKRGSGRPAAAGGSVGPNPTPVSIACNSCCCSASNSRTAARSGDCTSCTRPNRLKRCCITIWLWRRTCSIVRISPSKTSASSDRSTAFETLFQLLSARAAALAASKTVRNLSIRTCCSFEISSSFRTAGCST